MKKGYIILGSLTIGSIFLLAFALRQPKTDADFVDKHARLVLRKVGHQLLLHAGDSASRILPIKQISEGAYEIDFQSSFSFKPDTLVKIVQQNLAASDLPGHYLVSVLECGSKEVVYGFEINTLKNDLVSCQGRTQPLGCYTIQVAFYNFSTTETNSGLLRFAIAVSLLSLVAIVGYNYLKGPRKNIPLDTKEGIKLGGFLLFKNERLLRSENETIELSDKECRLLEIFATNPNQLIERDRLLKDVWEDDGVFTARSLDMFVSKLRKKIKSDPSIQITNVYGKGYKLEVPSKD